MKIKYSRSYIKRITRETVILRWIEGKRIPRHVTQEFEAFLRCGILAHGFLRVVCSDCKFEKIVAFSCKKRGFCSSCGGRRMAESAAHLIDEVFPKAGIRQWVLSFPMQVRFILAKNPKIQGKVLGHQVPVGRLFPTWTEGFRRLETVL